MAKPLEKNRVRVMPETMPEIKGDRMADILRSTLHNGLWSIELERRRATDRFRNSAWIPGAEGVAADRKTIPVSWPQLVFCFSPPIRQRS
jgi:hypothetical protein